MDSNALERFIIAQDKILSEVNAELTDGRKKTHWMWFVFPQLAGLGRSSIAQFYALRDLDEARRYLAHPVLGPRLREHVRLMLRHADRSALSILGTPDDLKYRSCLTVFEAAAATVDDKKLFADALEKFYAGGRDPQTLGLLQNG